MRVPQRQALSAAEAWFAAHCEGIKAGSVKPTRVAVACVLAGAAAAQHIIIVGGAAVGQQELHLRKSGERKRKLG